MGHVVLPTDQAGNPISTLLTGLSKRKVPLTYASGDPNPVAALGVAFRQLAGSLAAFLDALDSVLATSKVADLSADRSNALAEHFRQVVYRMTEALDFYAFALPGAFGDKRRRSLRAAGRDYRAAIKRHRDHWALICNKLKHNGNVLVPVAINYVPFGPNVLGVGVCSYQSDILAPNPMVHPNQKALGYAAELHRLAADILKCDVAAGLLASSAEEDAGAPVLPDLSGGTLPLGMLLARIALLTPVGMGEKRTQEVIALAPGKIRIARQFLPLPSFAGRAQMHFFGDGFTRGFGLFR